MKTKSLLLLLMLAFGLPWAARAQKELPYEYGFENHELYEEGWAMGGSSFSLSIVSGTGHSGEYYFQFYGTSDQYQYLVSPELSLTSDGLLVEFYYKNNNSSFPQSFQVGYSIEGSSISDFVYDAEVVTASSKQWTLYSKVFPANTKYISVRRNGESNYLYVDDFYFANYSNALAPKDLVLQTYTSTTATLDWSGRAGQDHWDIYCTDGSDVPNASTTPSVSNTETKPYTISVSSGMPYHAYVRANYGESTYSNWSSACDFEVGCYTPTNFRTTKITCNSARLAWNAGGNETAWQLVYSDVEGFNPNTATPITLTTRYKVLEGLTTGTTYYAYVRAKCSEEDFSDWSTVCGFTPQCFNPSNLHASAVSTTTATLAWTKGSDETQWQISYSTTENFTPENGTIINVSTNPYTLEGLTLNTPYYAYVRAVCGENIISDWSNVCAFMPCYNLTVNDASDFSMNVPFYGSQVGSTTCSQFIIPSDALSSVENATITKLVFHSYIYSNLNFGAATFDVCMKEVDELEFASTTMDWSDTTRVYYGSVAVVNNQLEIAFKKPFTYFGGNLLIGFSQTASGTGAATYWYGSNTSSNTALASYGGYSSLNQFLPKTTMYYTPGEAPTCIKPNNLTASGVTSNSAVLTWDAGEGSTWNVQYKMASASEWIDAATVSSPTCTLNNLSPGTDYRARVQTKCEGDDVSTWRTVSFTTQCGAMSIPYTRNFDNDASGTGEGLPPCWTPINDGGDGYPYLTGSNAYSEPNCMLFYRMSDFGALNQIAVLPEMDAALNTLQISFYAKLGSGTNEPLSIGVMSDPENASTFVKFQDVTIASTTYSQYMVNFETYVGTGGHIAFKCERGDGFTQIYVDDIAVTTNSVCFAPTAPQISNVTAHTANITWTPGSEVTNWQVQYKKTTDANWSESVAVNGTPTHTFSNLDAVTTYQARVRTNCGNDNYSEWVEAENFTTDCGFMTLPYSHDFEDDATGHVAPICWHFSDGTYPYIQEFSSSAHSGSHYLQIQKNTNYASTWVLPAIDTDEHPINTLKLTFWAKAGQSSSYYDYLYAGVMTDPDDMSTFQSVIGTSTSISNSTYKQFEFYFDNWMGEGNYIALRYAGSTPYCIDDIEISVAPTCRQPLDLSTQYAYAHEAEIRWKSRDLRQRNYQVSYSTDENFNPENGTIVDVEFENTLVNAGTEYRDYYLTCLNANTTYYYYVRANCGNGDFSEWSEDYASLTTGEACPAPYGFYANTVKNTYAKLQWYGDFDEEWEFRYKKTADEDWTTVTDMELMSGEGSELIYRLTGLEPGAEYEAQLRRHCGIYSCPTVDDGYSDWVSETFTTTTGCSAPEPWMCLTHMGTSAKLEWYQTGEERQWQIRYRLDEEWPYPEENIVLTDEMPEARKQRWTIEGLQTNSMYYWQVRAYCDSEHQSDWSDEKYFFTGGEKVTVDKTHPFYEDFEGDDMPDGWMRCNQYNYDLDYYYPWSFTLAEGPSWDERPGNHGMYNNSDDYHGSTSVLTPEMHIDGNAYSAKLSFWDYCDYGPSAISGQNISYGSMQVMVSSDHGENFDYVWWSFGPKRYWHQFFVDLDEYIGRDIIIRFDYWWANNNPNFDWYVDDVKVQVFDNAFGIGSGITSGDWDDPSMWGNGTPDGDDDVIINANVTIPNGVVAEANNIVINTDTINTGGRAQKFGKLTIANGGQLITNNAVEVTAQKTISPWTINPVGGWYLIASPLSEAYIPAGSMVSNTYDLYRLNNTTWENFKNTDEHADFTSLVNGQGYLYANSDNTTLEFTGEIKTYDAGNNTVMVTEGWSLIGNPYTFEVYPNTSYYVMNGTRTGLDPQTKQSSNAVPPCTGIIVKASTSGTVAFSKEAPAGQTGGGSLQITLTQANTRSAESIDNAIVSFNQDDNLAKFYFGESNANIYLPQNGEEYAIVSAESQGELPLNFKTTENGSYTLGFNSVDTEFSYLHLIDNLTGADINLLETPSYSFDARHSDYTSRFKIVFVKGDAEMGDNFAFISNGQIIVSGKGILQIIDVMGRVIENHEANDRIVTNGLTPGAYVLRLIDGDNVKNQKIIIK
ncbi:MAG: fibronectin type III domain-containing protein [Bacteroidales bacterium]|nr:fibronectin type III domain-containing protein [Bacteroidales bacterium]